MSVVAARPSCRYYHWWVSGKPISVQLASTVIPGLAEIKPASGGLLLGRLLHRKRGTECEVIVDGYEPLPCNFNSLSEDLFNEAERVVWERALTRQRQPGADGLTVVGYYRDHRNADLWLSAWDLALIRRYFTRTEDVFLLIDSDPDKPAFGGFFFKEGQAPHSGNTYLRFPMDPRKLVLEMPLSLAAPPVTAPQPEAPAPIPSQKKARGYRWMLIPVSGLTLLAAGYFGYKGLRPATHRVAEASPQELRIQSEPAGLRVMWNQNSNAAQQAESGVFTAVDGKLKQEITLDPKEIAFGSVVYTPKTSDVKFTLTLQGRSGELLRASARALVPPAKTTPKPLAVQAPVEATATPVTSFRRFEGPAPAVPVKTELIPEPPSLVSRSTPTPSAVIQPRLQPLAPPPEPVKLPPPPVKVEPPRTTRPLITTEAVAIRKVLPARPAQLQLLLSRLTPEEANIGVKLYIDAEGKVTRAEPLLRPKGASTSNYLGRLAADAAVMWRFKPATIDERPVPSETMVYFNFRPR